MKSERKKNKGMSFRERVLQNARRQKEARSSYGYLRLPKGVKIFNPKPGSRILLDFLPYTVTDANHFDRDESSGIATVGTPWYKRPFKSHRDVGPDNEAVVCLTTVGKKCPICDYRTQRVRAGAERDETNALRSKDRSLYIVVPRGDKDHEEIPYIWNCSWHMFQKLLNEELEEDDRYGGFASPDADGYSLKIRFDEESYNGKKFAKVSRIDFVERGEAIDEKLLEGLPNLDEILTILPYAELDKKFLDEEDPADPDTEHAAGAADDDEDDDKDDAPPRRRRDRDDKDDDDDAEDDDKDEDEDEDKEDEKPARRRSKDKDDEEEDEEDSDDDDSDDDEDDDKDTDPPPRRRSKDKDKDSKQKSRRDKDDEDDDSDDDEEDSDSEDDDGEEEEQDDDTPSRRSKDKTSSKETSGKDKGKGGKHKCPAGGKFGVDTDKLDECDECPLWEACIDAKEAASG